MKKRWPFLLIAVVLLAWAGYLSLGAALNQRPSERYAVLKPLIILGSMGLFLAFWWMIFSLSAKRRAAANIARLENAKQSDNRIPPEST